MWSEKKDEDLLDFYNDKHIELSPKWKQPVFLIVFEIRTSNSS